MNKIRKITVFVMLIMFVACCVFIKRDTQAAGKKTKAMKAYKKFLAAKSIDWDGSKCNLSEIHFMTVDIDGDKIPELILENNNVGDDGLKQKIYTYKNKKVKHLLDTYGSDFEIYPQKHTVLTLISYDNNTMEIGINKILKGKTKKIGEYIIGLKGVIYKINGKKVSSKKFNKFCNKNTTKNKLKMDFMINTEENRNAVLK